MRAAKELAAEMARVGQKELAADASGGAGNGGGGDTFLESMLTLGKAEGGGDEGLEDKGFSMPSSQKNRLGLQIDGLPLRGHVASNRTRKIDYEETTFEIRCRRR